MRFSKRIYALLLPILVVGMQACDKFEIDKAELSKFTSTGNATYYVTDNPNSVYKIPIGITTVADRDRTVNFTVTSSTAVEGQQYILASKSIVIPAGKAVDSIPVKGIFAGYSVGRKDTLIFTITGGDVTPLSGSTTYKLYVQKYCNVVLNDLLGNYANSSDLQEGYPPASGPYTAKVVSATSTGPTSAKLVIYNFGAPMFGDPSYGDPPYDVSDLAINPGITVNIDWADPANFKVTVPSQVIASSIYGSTGLIKPGVVGTFSSCSNTLTIKYSFAIGSTNYGNFVTALKR